MLQPTSVEWLSEAEASLDSTFPRHAMEVQHTVPLGLLTTRPQVAQIRLPEGHVCQATDPVSGLVRRGV